MFFDLVGEDELDPIRSAAAAEGRDTAIPVGHFWRVIVHTPDPLDDEAYCLQFGVVPIDWPTDHLVEFIFDLVE